MRIFYEATEITADETVEADFVRADVTELTEVDRDKAFTELKIIIPEGNYVKHICLHEEGQACQVTPL